MSDNDQKIYSALQNIAGKISETKAEVASNADKIADSFIPDANMELDAVVKATEKATHQILDAAEKIQGALEGVDKAKADEITGYITQIFEASNFQDITGQRINKVVSTLKDIETSINELLGALDGTVDVESLKKKKKEPPKTQEEKEKALMNGPQLEENAPSQDDIDKLFTGSEQ